MSLLEEARQKASEGQQKAATATILEGPKPRGIVKEPYVAYSSPTNDPQLRVIIYAKKFYLMPQYSVLYDVFFAGKGEGVSLIFPHHRILLWGRNLLDIVYKMRTNAVEWIREYDPLIHEMPVDADDPDAPVIESIEIFTTLPNPMGDPKEKA